MAPTRNFNNLGTFQDTGPRQVWVPGQWSRAMSFWPPVGSTPSPRTPKGALASRKKRLPPLRCLIDKDSLVDFPFRSEDEPLARLRRLTTTSAPSINC